MRSVLALLRPGQAALAIALGTLTVLSGAALLAASGALISGAALQPESLLVLMPLITSVRLFGVSRATLRYAERVVSHDLTLRLVTRLRAELLARLVPLAPAALIGARGGDLLARIRADVDELQGLFVRLVAPAAVAVLASAAAVGLTAFVSPTLALVLAALLLVLGVAVPLWARSAGRRPARDVALADAAFGTDTLDLVRGLADHASGDGGATALRTLDAHLDRLDRAERAEARLVGATTFLREGVPALGVVAALWLVGWDVAFGATNPVLLAATALGVLGSFEAVGGLGAAWAASERIRDAADRVQALSAEKPAVTEPAEAAPLPAGTALRFEDVTLTYPDAMQPALTDFDLSLGEGEKVALAGPSGAGKSSVLALALRSRDPDAGHVTLDGTDLRALTLADVRGRFAWAPQTPQILGGTLAGNLRLARDDASVDELEAVLREVGLQELPVGLDGWIGEAGERLSAGERARVGVARALLSPAPVLLLDEPTAHLDAPMAIRLLDLLARQPRTVLLVTHTPDVLDERWRVVRLDAPVPSAVGR
jgi:thiol reductant ABC exporter CydC subunit